MSFQPKLFPMISYELSYGLGGERSDWMLGNENAKVMHIPHRCSGPNSWYKFLSAKAKFLLAFIVFKQIESRFNFWSHSMVCGS